MTDNTGVPRPGQAIALCVLALLCIGVVMVRSAGMTLDQGEAVTFTSIVLSRSSAYGALALVAMLAVALLPGLERIRPELLGPPVRAVSYTLLALAFFLGVALLLVYVPGLGREVNGARRWINLPLAGSLQPSELAKWGLVVILAAWGAWQGAERMGRFGRMVAPLMVAGCLSVIVMKEDLGTAALMMVVTCIVLVAAGARILHLAAFIPPAAIAVGAAIIASPYRLTRLTSFMDPYAEPEGAGYHMIQSMVAVAHGGVAGRGLGFGLQKFGYLPEDRTDFLFAVICEETGLAGAAIVMALYAGLLLAGLSIIRRLPERLVFEKLLGLGVLATVGVQAVINLAVVTGWAPTKGIALPLLSSGGTGWIVTAASLGLLIRMDRLTEERAEDPALAPAAA